MKKVLSSSSRYRPLPLKSLFVTLIACLQITYGCFQIAIMALAAAFPDSRDISLQAHIIGAHAVDKLELSVCGINDILRTGVTHPWAVMQNKVLQTVYRAAYIGRYPAG